MYFLIWQKAKAKRRCARSMPTSRFCRSVCRHCLLVCVWGLRERPNLPIKHRKVGSGEGYLQNSHARLLLIVIFIENLGGAAITILTLYTAQYVMNAPEMARSSFFLIWFSFRADAFMDATGQAFRQKRLWLGSMLTTAFAFGCMMACWSRHGIRCWYWPVLPVRRALVRHHNPSIKSDIIDLDEYRTGERKEGAISRRGILSRNRPMG